MYDWETPEIKTMKMAPARNGFVWVGFSLGMIFMGIQFDWTPLAFASVIAICILAALVHYRLLRRIDGTELHSRVNLVEGLNLATLQSLEAALHVTEDEKKRSELLGPLLLYLTHQSHNMLERKELLSRLLVVTLFCVAKYCREKLEEEKSLTPLPKTSQKDRDRRNDDLFNLEALLNLIECEIHDRPAANQ